MKQCMNNQIENSYILCSRIITAGISFFIAIFVSVGVCDCRSKNQKPGGPPD